MREGWWWAVKAAVAGVLVLSLLAVAGWKSGDKLPADPLQRVAAKALRGEVYEVAVAQGPWRVEVMAEEPVLDAGYVRTSVEVDKQGLLRDWRRDPRLVEGLPVRFTRSRYVRVKP